MLFFHFLSTLESQTKLATLHSNTLRSPTVSRRKRNVPLFQITPGTGRVLSLGALCGRASPVAVHLVQGPREPLVRLHAVPLVPLRAEVFYGAAQPEEVRLDPHLLLDEGDGGVVGGDHEHGPLRRPHEVPEVQGGRFLKATQHFSAF